MGFISVIDLGLVIVMCP